jgi:Zn-dependent protease with chaperone function
MRDGEPQELYPASPTGVTPELTAASPRYKRHVALACLGVLVFLLVYLGLTGYLGWIIYRLLGDAILHGGNIVLAGLFSLPALFFFGFLVRGLFAFKSARNEGVVEVSATNQPRLFAFLHRLADETGAPRPTKVFLSAGVNAMVFYDISFWNLFVPAKKNLELGLALINVLSLDELKAVVAHEYGHFAQRSTALGNWVYVAHQITAEIVGARSGFDTFLMAISSIDIRVAWIGWIMRLFVWAIRAVLDTFFRIVLLAKRALGREMEFQADRVAVSVSGSDSLIHALHRLHAAQDAWQEALIFANDERAMGRPVMDLFALQSAAVEHLRRILDEPDFGVTPTRPEGTAQAHRVFSSALAMPPRMWMTHPPDREREDHAKEIYIPSALDPRPAWALFEEIPALQTKMTASHYALIDARIAAQRKGAPPLKPLPPAVPIETTLGRLEEHFVRPALDTRYRGAFMGRSIAAYDKQWRDMIGKRQAEPVREEVLAAIDAGYPDSLRDQLSRLRDRREEEHLLEGLERGVLTAPGGVIRYQGEEIPRRKLDKVISKVKRERREVEEELRMHDRAQRAAYLDAAKLLGADWEAYLESLISLLHYTTHAYRDVADAHGSLHHTLRIVLADGSLSSSERQRLLGEASDMHHALSELWRTKASLELPPAVQARFADKGGFEVLQQKLGLNAPSSEYLGDWMAVVDGWAGGATGDMRVLSDAVLDTLLTVEESIAKRLRDGTDPGEAPAQAKTVLNYPTRPIGSERERQKTLGWWDRFQVADGFFPGAARLIVASGLLLPALFVGSRVGGSTVHIHNGLPVHVHIEIGESRTDVGAHSDATLSIQGSGDAHVVTTSLRGEVVDDFHTTIGGGFSEYVYNVAQASSLVEWTAFYGSNREEPQRLLGAPRFVDSRADLFFRSPPHSSSNDSMRVLVALDALPEGNLISAVQQWNSISDPEERLAFVRAHLRFEPTSSRDIGLWFALGEETEASLIEARIAANPEDVFLRRLAQDRAQGADHERICSEDNEASANAPNDPNKLYLAIRCRPDDLEQDNAFLAAFEAHPGNGWLAWAAGNLFERQADWTRARAASEVVFRELPPLQDHTEINQARYGRRLYAVGVSVPVPSIAPGSNLEFLMLSISDASDPTLAPFLALRAGDLETAQSARRTVPASSSDPDFTVFVGASENATPEMIHDALVLAPEALINAQGYAYALALREGGDAARYLPSLAWEPRIAEVFASLRETPEALDALALGHDAVERGMLYAMGLILLREEAPPAWRMEATTLLFVPERPYFAAPEPSL